MEWFLGVLFFLWIALRETKGRCSICNCKRKTKHLTRNIFGQEICEIGCLHVAFIAGKWTPQGVIYNWYEE